MKIDQSDPNLHFAAPQNLQKTTRPKQKIILLNFEQNDQKEASEPDHVMLDRIKMSKTAATAKKWAAQLYWRTGEQSAVAAVGDISAKLKCSICVLAAVILISIRSA